MQWLQRGKVNTIPYEDPERKRQWEREHREQRNAKRRKRWVATRSRHSAVPTVVPDPASTQQSGDGWKVLASLAFGIGVVLLGVIAGVRVPISGYRQ